MTDVVMVDLEGTLSDHTGRLAVLQQKLETADSRDRGIWKEYYKGLPDDEPRHEIMGLVREWIRAKVDVIVYSTRFINKYNHEEEWLRGHELWEGVRLLQRQPHQTRIKGPELVQTWVRGFKPSVLVDDRKEVRHACRGLIPGLVIYAPDDLDIP